MKSVTINNVTIGEGIPKICVPIVGVTKQDIFQEINQMNTEDIDLIEWRSDWYEYCFDIPKVLQTLCEIKNMMIIYISYSKRRWTKRNLCKRV